MRVFSRRVARYDSGPNLTSLVDVVMVVLIFLMLAGSFSAARVVKGPTAVSPHGCVMAANVLEIYVRSNPAKHSFVALVGSERIEGDPDELAARLEARHHGYLVAGTDPAAVQVIVCPAGGVSYQDVLSVYESARRGGFGRVAFARSR